MSDSGGENTGRKGFFDSFVDSVSGAFKRANIGFVYGPRRDGGFFAGFEYPRREPTEVSITISPAVLEQLEKRREATSEKPTPPPDVKRRRNTAPASQIWPSWANNTYRDPTAETRSQTRQLEKRIENTDFENVPGVGPFVGAKREVEELRGGKKPDKVTATRTVRVVSAVTPAKYFPGGLPTKIGVGGALGQVNQRARSQSKSSDEPPKHE
ncbi:MAG: hypothetical protein ACJ8NR_11605 [Sulfurifustis sp.]